MKNIMKLVVALVLIAGSFSCASQSSKKAKLKTNYDTVSYMIGMSIGTNLAGMPSRDDLSPQLIEKGISDMLNEGDTLFTMVEMQKYLSEFSQKEQEKTLLGLKPFATFYYISIMMQS